MRLRLHGTPAECAVAPAGLRRISGLHIVDQSRPSPDRSGEPIRVYLTARLDPTSRGDRPGHRVGAEEELRRHGWSQPAGPSQQREGSG